MLPTSKTPLACRSLCAHIMLLASPSGSYAAFGPGRPTVQSCLLMATTLPASVDCVAALWAAIDICVSTLRCGCLLLPCCLPGADRLWLRVCSLVLSQKGDVRGRKTEKDTAKFGMDLKHCDLQVSSCGIPAVQGST